MSNVDRVEVLQHAERHGSAAAAQRYGISPATVRSWKHRAGDTATIAQPAEATEKQGLPGPQGWPVISIDVPIAGAEFQGQTFGPDGVARIPTVTVKAPRVLAGPGRSVQALGDGQHLRVPVADAGAIPDGAIVAVGTIAVRVMGRRSAAHDRNGQPLQLDADTRERLGRFVLLRIEPARHGEGQRRQTRPDSIPGLPTRQPGGF